MATDGSVSDNFQVRIHVHAGSICDGLLFPACACARKMSTRAQYMTQAGQTHEMVGYEMREIVLNANANKRTYTYAPAQNDQASENHGENHRTRYRACDGHRNQILQSTGQTRERRDEFFDTSS